MRVNDIHNPLSMDWKPEVYPEDSTAPATPATAVSVEAPSARETKRGERTGRRSFRGVSSFRDDRPPTTVITHAIREGDLIQVRGTTSDSSDIKRVLVNGAPARSTRASFAEWEITLSASSPEPLEIVAFAEDVHGQVETRTHRLTVK
jgi:hypothetical protein